MDTTDWPNGLRYHNFDTRTEHVSPRADGAQRVPVWRPLRRRPPPSVSATVTVVSTQFRTVSTRRLSHSRRFAARGVLSPRVPPGHEPAVSPGSGCTTRSASPPTARVLTLWKVCRLPIEVPSAQHALSRRACRRSAGARERGAASADIPSAHPAPTP